MVAKNKIELNPLVKTLFEELKKRKVSVPDFSSGTGIPKDRIYKWKQQGTAPKDEDSSKIREWIKTDKYPTLINEEEIRMQGEIDKIFGDHEERLLRIEAHLEVFQDAIAGLQAENKNDFAKKVGALRQEVQAAVNRRFDELKKKSSGL